MKAIRAYAFGGPEVLRLDEVPDPRPGAGEVLIGLKAAGVNPFEVYIRTGSYAKLPSLPYTPGHDGAGTVLAVGAGVSRWQPGDRVYVAGVPTYAEQAVAPADAVWPLPERLTFEQGAAIGVPYATANRALFGVGRAEPGDWVLIHGASGAVGTAAVQLAAARGLRVVGTAGSDAGRAVVLAQGAERALPHNALEEARAATDGHGYDVIIEMLANVNLGADLPLLARGGRVVVVGSRGTVEINPRDLMAREAAVLGMTIFNTPPEALRRIHLDLGAGLANGSLVPVVGRRFPLAEAGRAQEAVMEPGAIGKVVLTI